MTTNIWDDIECEPIKEPPTIQKIALHMALMHDVSIAQVKGNSRRKILVDVRQKIAKQAYDVGYKYDQIADFFGHKDHTTVQHYIKQRVAS